MRRLGLATVLLTIVSLSVLGLLIWAGYGQNWTGFTGQNLWDWMDLLIIPAVLGGGALFFNQQQRARERESVEQRAEADRESAERRAQTERRIELDRARESALETYLDRMSALLLDRELSLSEPGADVRQVAQARTLTVLRRLNGERKGILLRFLFESGLITRKKEVILLAEADLTGVDLSGALLLFASLSEAHLSEARLSGAHLSGADLSVTDLSGADLRGAGLSGAELGGADLGGAGLGAANLRGANLRAAKVTKAQLKKAKSLEGAIMPDGTKHE